MNRVLPDKVISGVLSRSQLIDTYTLFDYQDALISIWSPGDFKKFQSTDPELIEDYEKMRKYFETSIRLEFWDTEDNVPGYDTISEEQAQDIIRYILDNQYRKFVIHCDAGQSRSAGVALAVECILKFNGDRHQFALAGAFVDEDRYSPNRKVYEKIMDKFEEGRMSGD